MFIIVNLRLNHRRQNPCQCQNIWVYTRPVLLFICPHNCLWRKLKLPLSTELLLYHFKPHLLPSSSANRPPIGAAPQLTHVSNLTVHIFGHTSCNCKLNKVLYLVTILPDYDQKQEVEKSPQSSTAIAVDKVFNTQSMWRGDVTTMVAIFTTVSINHNCCYQDYNCYNHNHNGCSLINHILLQPQPQLELFQCCVL